MRRILHCTGLAASALLALPAAAPVKDRPADWLKRPSAESIFALWPPEAYRRGQPGKAMIECTVTVQGTLRACKVVSESPEGVGFGRAAIGLSPQLLMRPEIRDGKPVESIIKIPINWSFPGGGHGDPQLGPSMRDRVYSRLTMLAAPTYAEVMAAYPAKARAEKVGGVVTLTCRIQKEGRLGACDTVREEPKRFGFAGAAKSMLPKFRAPTADNQGDSIVGARVMLVVTFAASSLDLASPIIGRPQWVQIPRVTDIEAVLPPQAKKAGVFQARVVMTCRVVEDGKVEGCKTETQEPDGLGFGQAAEQLAPYFKLSVWTEEGLPTVGGSIRIPVRFDLAPPAVPAVKPGG